MQIYVKFQRKSTHFIETMQINLHISEFFCTFARSFACITKTRPIHDVKLGQVTLEPAFYLLFCKKMH